jgi:hypothetical protein
MQKVKLMSSVKRDKFFKAKFEGVNPIRDLMNSDTFFEIEKFSTIECRFFKIAS